MIMTFRVLLIAIVLICWLNAAESQKKKKKKVVQVVNVHKPILKKPTEEEGKGSEVISKSTTKKTSSEETAKVVTNTKTKVTGGKENKVINGKRKKTTEKAVQIITTNKNTKVVKKVPESNTGEPKKPITEDTTLLSTKKKTKALKPKDVWEKLKGVKSSDELLRLFDTEGKIKYRKVEIRKPPVIAKDFTSNIGYVFESGVSVSSDSKNQVARDGVTSATVFKELGCEPRPIPVQVPIAVDGAYWPACVELMQCSGCCVHANYQECAPVSAKNRSTPVWKIDYKDSSVSIHNVYMIHHAQCGCRCRVQPSDCKPTQTHNPQNCACECRKTPEVCPSGKQWSDIECGCVCSQVKQVCPTRHIWSEDNCRCECNKEPCPLNHTRDPSTCYCLPHYNGGKN